MRTIWIVLITAIIVTLLLFVLAFRHAKKLETKIAVSNGGGGGMEYITGDNNLDGVVNEWDNV